MQYLVDVPHKYTDTIETFCQNQNIPLIIHCTFGYRGEKVSTYKTDSILHSNRIRDFLIRMQKLDIEV